MNVSHLLLNRLLHLLLNVLLHLLLNGLLHLVLNGLLHLLWSGMLHLGLNRLCMDSCSAAGLASTDVKELAT